MADLDATFKVQRTRAVGSKIPLTDFSSLNRAISRKITAHGQPIDVLTGSIRTRNPRRSINNARINQETDPANRVAVFIQMTRGRIRPSGHRTDVARNQLGILRQVFRGRHFHLSRCNRGLEALHVNVTIPRNAEQHNLALPIGMGQGHHKALQGIRGLPRTILTRIELVRALHQSIDRRGIGRLTHLNRRNTVERNRLRRGGHHGLGISGVATRGTHESILTDRAGMKELFGTRAAHRTRHR